MSSLYPPLRATCDGVMQYTQGKELLVKRGDSEIFLSHDSICDIVGTQLSALAGKWVWRWQGELCEIANSSDPLDNFTKKWGLDIFLENVWEMGSVIWVSGICQVFEEGRYKSGICPQAALCSRRIE